MKKYAIAVPNIITSLRIIGAIAIIFLEPLSLPFFIVYSVCGLTDLLDGFIARKFNLSSKFGAVLDSVSDIIFLGIMAFKMLPILIDNLTIANWLMIAIPFVFHFASYLTCAFKYKKFSALHTYLNKLTSCSIFLFPFTFINNIPLVYTIYLYVFGSITIIGGLEVLLIHILSTRYDLRNKTILFLKKNEQEVLE